MTLVESMFLWLPTNIETEEESEQLIERVTLANDAVIDFCEGNRTFSDSLEIISACNIDIDNYLDTLSENFRTMGV